MFTLEVHHNGDFVQNPNLTYIGGSVKHIDKIDPDYMSKFELDEILKQLQLPTDMQVTYKMPNGEFVVLDNDQALMTMFGLFRDEPYIHMFIGYLKKERLVENGACGIGTHLFSDPREVSNVVSQNIDDVPVKSDETRVAESDESENSDMEYFLDGDTLDDDFEVTDHIDLGEYTSYAQLISGDYEAFIENKQQGIGIEPEKEVDPEILESAGDSSDDASEVRYPVFNEEKDMDNPQIVVGLVFSNVQVYRKALRMYSIRKGFQLKFQKNDPDKVIVICMKECGWRIYASYYKGTKAFQVKSIRGTPHRCPWSYKNKSASVKWLSENLCKELADNPDWKMKGIAKTIRSRYRIQVSKWKIYRARKEALETIHGDEKLQYSRLRDYCATIMEKNRGSAAYVQSDCISLSQNPVFKRMFVMYGAQKDGFISGCRPVIGLDACHLKGKFGGHLMHAVGRDGNNQMYPLAMAWVESECKDSWTWFLSTLTDQIGSPPNNYLVFISDRQKGLVETIENMFHDVEHRFCVRHMYANFKLRFRDKTLRDIMWAAARAYEIENWRKKMMELEIFDKNAYRWLNAIPPHLWARCMFNPRPKCDLLTNNISESFNQYISTARDEPILTLFETIRRLIMCRYQEKKMFISKVKGNICPKIHDMLEEMKRKSFDYEPLECGQDTWEVKSYNTHFIVNLHNRTCTCRRWDMTGIPCEHACAAIMHDGKEATDYVHHYYSVDYYKRAYGPVIIPIPDSEHWVQTNSLPIQPPKVRKRPGRPKKLRRKGPDEVLDSGVFSRKGTIVHCSNCKQAGHNRRGCREPSAHAQNNDTYQLNQSGLSNSRTATRQSNLNVATDESTYSFANGTTIARRTNVRTKVSRIGSSSNTTIKGTIDASTSSHNYNRGNRTSARSNKRSTRGRGKNSVFAGPYSGFGNWNGIGMSNMNSFITADEVARRIMHHNSGERTVQMSSLSNTQDPLGLNQAVSSNASSIQIQRQSTRLGDVLFSSQNYSSGFHVHKDTRRIPNEDAFEF